MKKQYFFYPLLLILLGFFLEYSGLDFLLELTAREQADMWLPLTLKGSLKLGDNPKHLVYAMKATGRSEALKPLLVSLKAGKLAADAEALAIVEEVRAEKSARLAETGETHLEEATG